MLHATCDSHDDCIGGLQVQTQTTGTRREDEHLVLAVGIVERREQRLTVIRLCTTIQTTVLPTSVLEEIGHDGHDLRHLEENQYFVTGLEQLRKDTIEKLKFTGGSNNLLVDIRTFSKVFVDLPEDEGMVADLSQLHQGVLQADTLARASIG